MHAIIVGTGVSSLLLAQALLRRGPCERLTLVGPRRPLDAHLLSYWSDRPTPFDTFEVASWGAVDVVTEGRPRRVPLSRFRYRTVRARAWAEAALASVLASGRAEHVEQSVELIDDDLLRPAVVCGGRRLRADWVFASTPAGHAEPDAWQRFEGWELELFDARVDTAAATLLDFRTAADGDFRFVYALPLGPGRLFVEHVSHQRCDHGAALEAYVRNVLGLTAWRVADREGGATPLYRERPPGPQGHVVHIGVAAGLAKASTGYAALRMWRDAEAIATALHAGRDPSWSAPPLPSLYRVADHFFIDLLRNEPLRLEALLGRLFASTDGDAVLGFLDEQASVAEQARVAAGMPGWLEWAVLGEPSP